MAQVQLRGRGHGIRSWSKVIVGRAGNMGLAVLAEDMPQPCGTHMAQDGAVDMSAELCLHVSPSGRNLSRNHSPQRAKSHPPLPRPTFV